MSFEALAWAVKQQPGRASDKLILLGLADRWNNEERAAWPSIKWLQEFSGLNRKTVITALQRLERAGMIRDTGGRVGKTRQGKVYTLSFDDASKSTEKGIVKESRFFRKESQKRDTEPIKEPIKSLSNESVHLASDLWNDVAAKTGWPQVRKLTDARRAKLKARLAEHGDDGWRQALTRAAASEWLGKDPPSWFTFDFLVKNENNLIKLLEGNYDKRFSKDTAKSAWLD